MRIGVTDKESEALEIQGIGTLQLNEVREGWAKALPELFG